MIKGSGYSLLSIAAIKKCLTPDDIEQVLDTWYSQQEKEIEHRVEMMSERMSLVSRQKECRENIDNAYRELRREFDLPVED